MAYAWAGEERFHQAELFGVGVGVPPVGVLFWRDPPAPSPVTTAPERGLRSGVGGIVGVLGACDRNHNESGGFSLYSCYRCRNVIVIRSSPWGAMAVLPGGA